MAHVIVYDEYNQPWKIEEDDKFYQEAVTSTKTSYPDIVVWPLSKIVSGRGYGWWTTFRKIDEFEADLEKMVPHPVKQRLIDIDKEYTPTELSDLLQKFGSYLAILHHTEGVVEAQCHALKEGFKTGLSVATAKYESKSKTTAVTAKEAEVLAGNELLKQTRRLQIDNEACLIIVKSWRQSYEQAFATASRLVTLMLGEAQLQTSRYA